MKIQSYWLVLAFSVLCVVGFVGFLAWNEIQHNQSTPAKIAVARPLPTFSLTAHNGSTVSRAELLGKVWVADFIFTTCPGPCQKMSTQMQEIQTRLKGEKDVRLVSFTVNPEVDTPQVLAKYAAGFNADSRWLFLTGDKKKLYELAEKGFLFNAVDTGDGSGRLEDKFIHDTKFAVVDRDGIIRTYIDGTADDAAEKVTAAVRHYLTTNNGR